MTQNKKTLVAFATGWGPQFGGINSFNSDLLPAIAAAFDGEVKTICVVPHASKVEVDSARSKKVSLISLGLPGTKEFSAELEAKVSQALEDAGIQANTAETVWLGHDRITGAIALAAAKKCGGRSALIHHMSYRHYEAFAENSAQASAKLAEQKKLFAPADIVLAVGPLLRDALHNMFDHKVVHMLVPGFPEITHRTQPRTFNAFLSGRLDDGARKIKQAYLGVAAFGEAISRCTEDCCLPDTLHRDNEPWLMLRGVEFEKADGTIDPQAEQDLNEFAESYAKGVLTLHALPFTKSRDELFNDLRAASVAMMPSWHEGFGLVAWEAIAAGVPLILSKKSGAYRLLEETQNGIYTNLVKGISIAGSNKHPYFRPEDLGALSDALIQIAKDPAKYRQNAAELHRCLLERYSWRHCARQFSDALGWNFGDAPATIEPPSNAPTSPTLPTAELVTEISIAEIRASFASTSAIGRTWHRDISGKRIFNPVVNKLLTAVDEKRCAILVTGLPGSGKTCVMLELQEALEHKAKTRADLVPLFIQSREFADQATAQERQAQGLPTQWVEQVARLAIEAQVVVVIDSLDVLSIAREHTVLTYFLAQIDRLLLIPNVTVITACRDFDRKYDRSIAERKWDVELTCPTLNWDTEIAPLLTELKIDTSTTDAVTRELIGNPRELAMFVELSQRAGSINAVTSQALTQHYIQAVVQENVALGSLAMQAIEAIADTMLKTRSLAVPRQSFTASSEILQALLSHNVLHETQDGKLAFGHQTLLDVLVISGAVRRGITLNRFIQDLPPVPFVRPSIRSFVAQLATGDRRDFRKQLRTVLTGNNAFHIRRLVAECLAEQIPEDDDWPLINDLRTTHRDVFQVIYTQATRLDWHYFWFKHLVPALKEVQDLEGLTMHVHRVSHWKNDDASGVLAFWAEVLALNDVNKQQISRQLEFALADFRAEHLTLLAPVLKTLLMQPREDHSFLGPVLARCLTAGGVDDAELWRFIAGDITNEDLLAYRFDNKLHCQPHEFGDGQDKFLADRMKKSIELLDMAVVSIEQWSQIKRSRYGDRPFSFWSGFLRNTSYSDTHDQTDHRYVDSERILLNAVEAAVVHHAQRESVWWQRNRDSLCGSAEGALRYFAILACTAAPATNLDVINRMLCDKPLLESDLSYELGTLMQSAFAQLDGAQQDAIQAIILCLHQEDVANPKHRPWILKKQGQLILTIPCHLRSSATQEVLDECEKSLWPLERQPDIGIRGGIVSSPFSFEVFLASSDNAVLRLLAHYNGYDRNSFDDFLVGGEREVGVQLREAASRHPTRFLDLLPKHWAQIPSHFCDDIMDGIAAYLAHRHGNLQSHGNWSPIEEPDAASLAQQILDELQRHPAHWHHNRTASSALQACAHVVQNKQDAEKLVFGAIDFLNLQEKSSISGDSVDLLTIGINMARGHIAEALMIVANRLQENSMTWPELLVPTLRQFAADDHPAIRALILRRLPYLQSLQPDLGWELFDLAMQEGATGLWAWGEPCLYHAYHQKFDIVAPWLARLYRDGQGKDLETWGRISALAALVGCLDLSVFLEELKVLDATEAWWGAAGVWTHPENIRRHRNQCLVGIEAGLNARNAHSESVSGQMCNLFRDKAPIVSVPTALIQRHFDILEKNVKNKHHRLIGLDTWLNTTAQHDPEQALTGTEIYLAYVKRTNTYLHDYDNNLTQLLTRLFASAEEREESDQGNMLKRVVAVQDTMLELGVDGINKWLEAAERP